MASRSRTDHSRWVNLQKLGCLQIENEPLGIVFRRTSNSSKSHYESGAELENAAKLLKVD